MYTCRIDQLIRLPDQGPPGRAWGRGGPRSDLPQIQLPAKKGRLRCRRIAPPPVALVAIVAPGRAAGRICSDALTKAESAGRKRANRLHAPQMSISMLSLLQGLYRFFRYYILIILLTNMNSFTTFLAHSACARVLSPSRRHAIGWVSWSLAS
jgi:hypothetical protein